MAGRQLGLIGMGLYVGFIGILFFAGDWVRRHTRDWPGVRDLGWTFQMQAVAFAVGGFFSPGAWNAPMMMLAGSASALFGVLKREEWTRMERKAGLPG